MKLSALPLVLFFVQTAGLQVPAFGPPTRTPAQNSPTELATLRAGIALYEQGKVDDAMAKFDEVLKGSPDNAMALYELALASVAKKDYQRAIDLAAKATEFKGTASEVAQYYGLIGNTLDMAREPKRAIEVYTKGLEYAPAASLHYNMAVTYAQSLADVPSAKAALKKGATIDPSHAGTQLLLARLFLLDDLKTAGLFALSRFLILEPGSARTPDAYQMWFRLLNGTLTQGAKSLEISVNPAQKKDEGDLMKLDLHISLSKVAATKSAEGRSQIQLLADQVDLLFGVYASSAAGDDSATFLWKYYMPFIAEMHQKKLVEPFVYYVSQRTNLPGVREWLTVNRERVLEFLAWAKQYQFPKTV
jgi:tetratricopeptide (TPR) repeat protein